ncbi:MAG: hypothetical protein AB1664_15655 [Thermodesulfobacteriota bacterium]
MKEQDVVTQFKNDLLSYCRDNNLGVFWHKIADVPITFLQAQYAKIYMGRKKPLDVLATIAGVPIAIEWKLHKSDGAIACDMLRDHQVEGLKEFHYAGGVALAAIATVFEVKASKAHLYPRDGMYRGKLYRIFFVPINVWLIAQTYASDRGRKSITQEQLGELLGVCQVCRRDLEGGRAWDVDMFWRHCYWLDTDEGREDVERALDGALAF